LIAESAFLETDRSCPDLPDRIFDGHPELVTERLEEGDKRLHVERNSKVLNLMDAEHPIAKRSPLSRVKIHRSFQCEERSLRKVLLAVPGQVGVIELAFIKACHLFWLQIFFIL